MFIFVDHRPCLYVWPVFCAVECDYDAVINRSEQHVQNSYGLTL